jgi:hypothetical protein
MTAQPPRSAGAALAPRGASHCYYNIITYNKNNIIYTTNNTIFYTDILNFNKNNNIF